MTETSWTLSVSATTVSPMKALLFILLVLIIFTGSIGTISLLYFSSTDLQTEEVSE